VSGYIIDAVVLCLKMTLLCYPDCAAFGLTTYVCG
jgi:hypothetical protein